MKESPFSHSGEFFKLSIDILVMAGFDGYVKEINPAGEKILGFTEAEFKSKPYLEFLHPEDRPAAASELQKLMQGERTTDFEVRSLCKDGSFKWISWSAQASSQEPLIYAVGHDVTSHRKLDQMRNDFISFVSHQLRTPVSELNGYIENMLGGLAGPLSEKQALYLQKMQAISVHNNRLISDLLNISQLERGMIPVDLRPVPLGKAVRAALAESLEVIKRKGLALDLKFADPDIMVLADLSKLMEAIKNVIDNAEKFTEKGSIAIRTTSNHEYGSVEISDTGKGISEEILAKIFTRDRLLKGLPRPKGGSGLGLYIAKSFLELQQGGISAESIPEKGSRFTIRVPKAR